MPQRVDYLAVTLDKDDGEREIPHLAELCRAFGVTPPPADSLHFSASLGPLRVKWERHTDLCGTRSSRPGESGEGFGELASAALPDGWVAAIPVRARPR